MAISLSRFFESKKERMSIAPSLIVQFSDPSLLPHHRSFLLSHLRSEVLIST
jgi:hypothetical protein